MCLIHIFAIEKKKTKFASKRTISDMHLAHVKHVDFCQCYESPTTISCRGRKMASSKRDIVSASDLKPFVTQET